MASTDPQRPNVVYVVSDDQGAWALGCAGNAEIRTPSLDRLAAGGMRFENFFCTSPVCSPARASLLTGDIPSQHGVHDWIRVGSMPPERIDYLSGQTLLPDVAAAAGYRCALVGKWHLGASDVPRPSFVKWFAHQSGMGPYYGAPMVDEDRPCTVEGYLSDRLGDVAIEFMRAEAGVAGRPDAPRIEPGDATGNEGHDGSRAVREERVSSPRRGESRDTSRSAPQNAIPGGSVDHPFWLSLNFTAPHYPWIDSHPAAFTDLYADCAFESCPEEPPHPWFIGGKAAIERGMKERRPSLIGYFAAVSAMDAVIGRVLGEIERLGLTRSTLVIFMSDNGMNCGHHGIWGKGNGTLPQNMYDTSVKVPCIIAQPGRIPAGRTSDVLLSGYDIFPTLVQYLGLPHDDPRPKPGRSFSALLEGGSAEGDREVVVYDEYGPVRMVRTRDWKYVHRYPDGPHELYDLRNDPDERNNLVASPASATTVAALRSRLETWFSTYVNPERDGVDKGVTGCGQLGRVEDANRGRRVFADQHLTGADWDLWLDKKSA